MTPNEAASPINYGNGQPQVIQDLPQPSNANNTPMVRIHDENESGRESGMFSKLEPDMMGNGSPLNLVINTDAHNSVPSSPPKFLSDGTPYVPLISKEDDERLASYKMMSTESSEGSCESDVSDNNLTPEDIVQLN